MNDLKILAITDVHNDTKIVKKIVEIEKPTHIIDGGDHSNIDFFNYGLNTLLIPGNHEPNELLEDDVFLNISKEKKYDLTLVKPGQVYEINNFSLAGFGKNYSKREWNSKDTTYKYMTFNEYNAMKKLKNVDILITHEAPKALKLFNRGENVGLQYIDDIINEIKPKLSLSGHHHVYKEDFIGRTKMVSLPDIKEGYAIITSDEKNHLNLDYKQTIKSLGQIYWSIVSNKR